MFETIAVIVAIIAALIAALLLHAARKPDAFRVERTTSVAAPPEAIYPFIEDFRKWVSWSPFETIDPALKRAYSGAERGQGAVYDFEGNNRAGAGRLTITEASASRKLVLSLDFARPCQARNIAEFTLEPTAGSTRLTWAMHGRMSFKAKVMTTFCNMDRMVGGYFEAGLAKLKALGEAEAATAADRVKAA